MRSYVVVFTDIDGDTCEVDQPARSAIDAVRAIHRGYGHLARRTYGDTSHYQAHTSHGIVTFRARRGIVSEVW